MNFEQRIQAVRKQRANQILLMRMKGFTLAAIGKKFGVSRQRVHQIISAATRS